MHHHCTNTPPALLDSEELKCSCRIDGKNEECQKKIFLMDNTRDYEKSTDAMLHEHKYLNTLANVHQVRYNLKETQDRYNRMAGELQNKLNEK